LFGELVDQQLRQLSCSEPSIFASVIARLVLFWNNGGTTIVSASKK